MAATHAPVQDADLDDGTYTRSQEAKEGTQWRFTPVPSYFIYDKAADGSSFPSVDPNFGLLPNTTWSALSASLHKLNKDAKRLSHRKEEREVYKLVYAARHGEGFHNVAEAFYGTAAWDDHWSKLNGNGTITWGPDALLTPKGEGQARDVRAVWLDMLARPDGAPLPSRLYSSPMTRSTKTLEISLGGISFPAPQQEGQAAAVKGKLSHVTPLIKEGFREMYGEHTCDQRRNKDEIHELVPEFRFERGFTSSDELWTTERETQDHIDARVQRALEDVWNGDDDDEVVGITSHSGVMQALFRVTGHSRIKPATGAFVPLVIRGTPVA